MSGDDSSIPIQHPSEGSTTYAALLTASAPAAIAVIEIEGPQALPMVARLWRPNAGKSDLEIDRIRYGVFCENFVSATEAGESIVVVRRADDRIELHCHGGSMASQSILRTLERAGATLLSPSQWLDRRTSDRIRSDAHEDLMRAATPRVASILMDQWRGELTRALASIEEQIRGHLLASARHAIEAIERHTETGLHLIQPWRVVLCGPPNVGKSSLLNRMLGYQRAIVHDQPGTTRDLLTEATSIDGWPCVLIDSAGIRTSCDTVESQGISKAKQAIESADRLLVLVDQEMGWTSEHEEIWRTRGSRCLIVQTKSDQTQSRPQGLALNIEPILVSAVSGGGLDELMQSLSHSLVPTPPKPGSPIPFRCSHVARLAELKQHC